MAIANESLKDERKVVDKSLQHLFTTFFEIGAFTIGGGWAMIPLIQASVVDKSGWLTEDDFVDIIAVSQSAPGPIAINVAVFTGYWVRGLVGAMVATLGSALPSFLVILAVAFLMQGIANNPLVQAVFRGLRPGVLALIVGAAYGIAEKTLKRPIHFGIAAAGVLVVAVLHWHPVALVAAAGLAGLVITYWDSTRKAKGLKSGASPSASRGEQA